MKKQKIKKALPEWRINLIDSLIDALDRMKDRIDESEGDKVLIEAAFKEIEDDIRIEVEGTEIEAKDCLLQKNFIEDFMNELENENLAGESDIEVMTRIIEKAGYETIKFESLAEIMKFEAFKEELEANPYQLNLIA